jgi:hypothetical protein
MPTTTCSIHDGPQAIKLHSLTFIGINTYQGEFIEEGSIIFMNSLHISQLTHTSVIFLDLLFPGVQISFIYMQLQHSSGQHISSVVFFFLWYPYLALALLVFRLKKIKKIKKNQVWTISGDWSAAGMHIPK